MSYSKIRKLSKPITLLYATNATTITATVELNGILMGISISAPDLDSTDTYTASILDTQGGTVWSKASLVRNTVTSVYTDSNNYYFSQPLHGTNTLSIVTSGNQTANRTFTVYIYRAT